jgi:hypothetical protein
MRTTTALAAAGIALAALTACSSSASTAAPAAAPAASAPNAASSAPAPSPAKATDAATVTKQLAAKIPTVKLTVTYDATSDPNGKLGRQHQYVSKTAFDDSRVSGLPKAAEDANQHRRDSISYGGTVEVFATADDAKAWADYVDKAQQALGALMTPDYIYQAGPVVVRVSHLLSADQAAQYKAAIGA